ncbi:hypothetical protein RHMOL_Rhmol13G0179100 [Rhododendron molle]|uniref:Uncharacterized protein n=1 Tax=Rhododendron molle TaxID=49168 RepID=A0ACC0L9J2_RHOML|nr:hypothetical protein RHMOL_Rhmol13G0179100 [Rhododendron molle]
MEQAGGVGPNIEPMGPGSVAEASSTVDRSLDSVDGSGAVGDVTRPSGSLPKDSAKGKGIAVEEEQATEDVTVEIREENIPFRPPVTAATSSRHVPITLDDIVAHTPDEILAKLLEDHPIIGEYVLKAEEDWARAIEASEAAARAEREQAGPGGLATDVKAEERGAEEAQRPRMSAMTEAGAMMRPEFSEETYTLPRPHLFVPSGFAGYRPPQQTDYDLELVLRDPRVHIANTWVEAKQRDIRGFGGPCSSLALYRGLPPRVRELVDAAGFREFIQTLTVPVRNDHAVLVALAERWRDTSNTFHLPPGE